MNNSILMMFCRNIFQITHSKNENEKKINFLNQLCITLLWEHKMMQLIERINNILYVPLLWTYQCIYNKRWQQQSRGNFCFGLIRSQGATSFGNLGCVYIFDDQEWLLIRCFLVLKLHKSNLQLYSLYNWIFLAYILS